MAFQFSTFNAHSRSAFSAISFQLLYPIFFRAMDPNANNQENVSLTSGVLMTAQYTLPSNPEWSTSHDWPFSGPASYNTPVDPLTPFVHSAPPLAGPVHGVEHHESYSPQDNGQSSLLAYNFPTHYLQHQTSITPPLPPFESCSVVPAPALECQRIPRPANAFMLFRSDFLKRRVIPARVERRQQTLSRIAGECWNLLPAEEKSKWQEQAAKELAIHQQLHPSYKFRPAPRRNGKTKGKSRRGDEEAVEEKRRIRELRETYAHVTGPAVAPTRRRKVRGQHHKDEANKEFHSALSTPLPPSIPPSPSLPSPEPTSNNGPSLPPFFPQYSLPHYVTPRRPSTSLGFTTHQDHYNVDGYSYPTRPPSAASSETGLSRLVQDLDITPTAATFRNISMPTPSEPSGNFPAAYSDLDVDTSLALRELRLPFNDLNLQYPDSQPPVMPLPDQMNDQLQKSGPDTFLGSLFSDEPLEPYVFATSFDDYQPISQTDPNFNSVYDWDSLISMEPSSS